MSSGKRIDKLEAASPTALGSRGSSPRRSWKVSITTS